LETNPQLSIGQSKAPTTVEVIGRVCNYREGGRIDKDAEGSFCEKEQAAHPIKVP
jgi:hypothetical protein